jgi:crotonobetainyl-CoA:carnitine CoA-transferase CaiB-like acyl-CoA transferase
MKTTAQWIALLESAAVPCGPINDLAGVFADPQVIHRGLRVDMPHAAAGAPQVANPIHFSATPIEYRRAPPLLGQDTETVLKNLGRGEVEIVALRAGGIV